MATFAFLALVITPIGSIAEGHDGCRMSLVNGFWNAIIQIKNAPVRESPQATLTLRGATKDHSLDDAALVKTASHDLDNTDVIDVEVGGILGHDSDGSLADKIGQHILVSVLLGGN